MNSNISPSDAKPYDIKMHSHRFSAWAASRAATVNGARFDVQNGGEMLEACGFGPNLSDPDQLPAPKEIDQVHKRWCDSVITLAARNSQISAMSARARLEKTTCSIF